MFGDRLKRIHDRLDDALAVSLVARDGMPVESHTSVEVDVEALAAELLTQVRALADDHRELAVGPVRQFAVTTDRYALMLGSLTEEYYLLLILGSGASIGRARYELRRASLDFEDDLV
jgi:predicted regulator of Ras-like GTPase activity (Roadblock/LC7/MglB family)